MKQEILVRLDEAAEQQKFWAERTATLKQRMVDEHCPYAIGEMVATNGHTNVGRDIVIDTITYGNRFGNGTAFHCKGYILLTSGGLSAHRRGEFIVESDE